ncbi:MAG: RlmE family RNA methyltransferase [Candidatus Thermoplasmatota archaeon]|nr:RlmE family RNA methyltransferase [Arenicellales bacterium]MEC7714058.1 RlmE family RNA methyltransferase [Candidatus Thermoplasmatota archaeon]MED5158843.1 RlmE family RNA methyltransferase [Candidatus Thermoplasmatota archaeon]MEE3231976.1 RlmE family RNA methyltransferase [Candidatus Thermoplasmatota archaeon]MEE3277493.1 RlmE family RNA methyltransferase [Candidatus Thermoplasmatota archaeon]|tara:strand:+ start:5683 stop:6432 length:750 start_codon:yes stop_codon:yes gene_type:complete
MSKRWYQDNRRDAWRRIARSKGYRTRSAYKLKQIQERFGILRNADVVLDVGCHPGGWTQVAVEEVGEKGLVIGVDLLATSPVEGALIIIGDVTEERTIGQIRDALGEREFNVVVSDISPNLTGRYDTDQTISLELSTLVLDASMEFIPSGGSFVTKIFQGTGIEGLIDAAKDRFSNVQRYSPTASRSASSETYLICQNRLPQPRARAQGKSALEQVQLHLSDLGIVVEKEADEVEFKVGFKRLRKREED